MRSGPVEGGAVDGDGDLAEEPAARLRARDAPAGADLRGDADPLGDVRVWDAQGGALREGLVPLIRSWERVFDLDTRFGYAPRMRRNRDIQATFWELRLEWVTSSSRLTGYQEWQRRKREKEETPE